MTLSVGEPLIALLNCDPKEPDIWYPQYARPMPPTKSTMLMIFIVGFEFLPILISGFVLLADFEKL